MLQIQVTTYKDLPPAERLIAEFNELGGSIGRADGNALVLPDPERHISRTHATIMYRAGKFVIRDLGTAVPVYVNGQALGNGREAPINNGDEIRIGGYKMRVAGKNTPAPQLTAEPTAARATPKEDPLALFGGNPGADPFADLLSSAPKAPVAAVTKPSTTGIQPATATRPSAPPLSLIPDDFDPFADPIPIGPEEALLGVGMNSALGPKTAEPSIDQLFDLGSGGNLEPLGPGEIAGSLHTSGTSEILDPLLVLGATVAPQRSAAPQRDDIPEIHSAFRPPEAKPEQRPKSPRSEMSPPSAGGGGSDNQVDPFGMMLSWETASAGDHIEIINSRIVPSPKMEGLRERGDAVGPRQAPSALTSLIAVQGEERVETQLSPRLRLSTPVAPTAAAKPRGDDFREELLRAFLVGAGIEHLNFSGGLTPGTMTRVGQLLREATQGTLDLLLARALTKREVRADVTMIAARDNNPLKFSPNVEVALAQLLAPQERGFMPPARAMRDAYDDLRSHQFGFMAGMRAALSGTLERLNPEQLEQRLKQKSVFDSLLPMNRKAKLWDLFSQYYGDIAEEAEEDFHALFGKEFLRAYEAQIAKLAKEEKDRGG